MKYGSLKVTQTANRQMTYDEKIAALFLSNFKEAYRSAKLLAKSHARIAEMIPLTAETMNNLSTDALDKLDAFRVRFCDLQDSLGSKTFRSLIMLEEEKIGTQLDLINKIEKRTIILSFDEWKKLRDIRNLFSHDYPDEGQQRAEALNIAHTYTPHLIAVLDNVKRYAETSICVPMDNFEFLGKSL